MIFALCHSDRKHSAKGMCKSCYAKANRYKYKIRKRAENKRWAQNHRELFRGYQLKNRYGITTEEKQNLINSQNGLCAICETNKATDLDHNHETNKIRGVLCSLCNKGLGQFKDNKSLIYSAYEYLSKYDS